MAERAKVSVHQARRVQVLLKSVGPRDNSFDDATMVSRDVTVCFGLPVKDANKTLGNTLTRQCDHIPMRPYSKENLMPFGQWLAGCVLPRRTRTSLIVYEQTKTPFWNVNSY